MRIGIYNVPDNADAHHVIFRKTFRVPENWDHGRVCLFTHSDVLGKWRRYLDGKPLQARAADDDLGGVLEARQHALPGDRTVGPGSAGRHAHADLPFLPAGSRGASAHQGPLVLRAGSAHLWSRFGLAADDPGRGLGPHDGEDRRLRNRPATSWSTCRRAWTA